MAAQNRKQIMNEFGDYVPVQDTPQITPPKEGISIDIPSFSIGDKVYLAGRVLETQEHQGGHTSVKVQLPQGAMWLKAEHLTKESYEPAEPVDETQQELPIDDISTEIDEDNAASTEAVLQLNELAIPGEIVIPSETASVTEEDLPFIPDPEITDLYNKEVGDSDSIVAKR